MPIGKNAIKRVDGNTKKEIPTAKEVVEAITAPQKPAVKKTTTKPTPKATKPAAPKTASKSADKPAVKTATAPKVNKSPEEKKDGFVRIDIGGTLPIYLL